MNLERPKLLNSESSRTICDKLCHIASPKSSVHCDGRDLVLLAVWQLGVDNSLSVCNCPLPDKQQTSLEPFCITFRETVKTSIFQTAACSEQGWQYWGHDLCIGCLRRTRTCELVPFVFFWNHEGHVCHSLNKLNIIVIRPNQFFYSMISPYDEAFQTMVQPFESQFDRYL